MSVAKNDWFELHNLSDKPLDLAGVSVSDSFSDPHKGSLSGVIEPRGFFVVKASKEELGFKLARDEQLLLMFAENPFEEVGWKAGDAPEGHTYGRFPDGVGEFSRRMVPSPGEGNPENVPVCGDGYAVEGEACDGEDVNHATCSNLGFLGGTMSCAQCELSVETCDIEWRNIQVTELTNDGFELVNLGNEPVDVSGWRLSPFPQREKKADIAAATKPLDAKEHRVFPLGGLTLPQAFVLLDDVNEIRDYIVVGAPTDAMCRTVPQKASFSPCVASPGAPNPTLE